MNVTDLLGQKIEVNDVVFYHGHVYKIVKIVDKSRVFGDKTFPRTQIYMNYLVGRQLAKSKAVDTDQVCKVAVDVAEKFVQMVKDRTK